MIKALSAACLLSILWCETLGAQTQCGVVRLDIPGGDAPSYDVNDSGVVVGFSAEPDQGAYIWSNGTVSYLKGINGVSTNATPYGLNKYGRVVGSSLGVDSNQHATLWVNKTPKDLGLLPGGSASRAEDINDLGHVVGAASDGSENHAFLWKGGELTALQDGRPNEGSVATAINNLDQIVGYDFEPVTRNTRALMWDHGTVTYLGSFGDSGVSVAYDINDSGQIVGQSLTGAGRHKAFLWENGVMKKLGTLGGITSQALAINSLGVIVGISTNADNRLRAFIWKNGIMKDLDPDTARHSSAAVAISNTGWVTGYIRKPADQGRFREPFRWKKRC
jgi:probable HAF family extracellular repeat protein